ncbi:hypothetical protein N9A86_01895 [Akkermansiaceae bacterium]|nr:hypothetical protein [Akkermansiaceae bacterium]
MREFGKRDELAAFALLDGLAVGRHTERWLMARVAVAGGWAIRDPAEASKALLNDGAILPKNFEINTGFIVATPSGGLVQTPYVSKASQVAIHRQASYIFKAWSEIEHEAAIHFTNSLAKDQTSAALLRMLRKHLILDRVREGSTAVNRSSIDAILNNPQRTSPYSTNDFGAEIHGDTLDSGEPAFTFEEWAARNPELAKESLVPKEIQHSTIYSATPLQVIPAWSNNLIAGLARTNPDYISLLELSAPENHFHTAYQIARSVGRNADDEDVWQLDGRESSWTLNFGQREKAMLDLIEEGNFSDEERAALKTKMEGEATRFDFIYEPPELPNKKPD